jgi:hypothetical protein
MEKTMRKMMSKLLIIALTLASLVVAPQQAKAGFTDSSAFEPVLGCVIAGAGGYAGGPKGQEMVYAAAGCGIGALIGVLLNMHYSAKYDSVYKNDLTEMRHTIKEMELQSAMRAANGEDENISIRIRQVIPGQKRSDGSVSAPTIVESLVPPGETVRVGD